jgi:undecaprenyl-phosphate 4-deoxy-4-formamido-L-arabinose transferase
MSYQLVSVILPVYRQANHIAEMVRAYVEILQKLPVAYEILLIVNGPDDSLAVCRPLELDHPTVRVLENEVWGWGPAVKRGLAEARGDLLCYANSARTNAGDLLLAILYAIAYPGVVIKASRRLRDSWIRRFGSVLYNLECRALFDLATFDLNGTPKVFPRALEKLLVLSRDDDVIDVEFNVICRREGYRMIEVPIIATTRHGGKSTTSLWSALRMYVGAFTLWLDLRRGASPSA